MAITIAAQAELSRLGTFFDPKQDWTWFLQVKNGSTTPATIFFRQYLTYGDPASSHAYIALRSPAASNNIVLKTFDGSTTSTSAAFTPIASTWAWIGATYVASTHTFTFYANSATPIGTLTVNLSSFVFTETTSAVGSVTATTSFGDFGVNYIRQWQVALTGAALVLEAASKTPVQMGTLLTDTPVQASIDLTAHNNTLTQWSATGTVTTDTADVLVTIVAAPPANTAPATATTIDTINVVFQDTLTAGAATTTWYKVACTEDAVWGAQAFGDLVTYQPKIDVFEGLANANGGTTVLDIAGTDNTPIQFPVTAGNDYYFKATRNAAVSPATVQISILKGLNLSVPAGSIAVNDDTIGFPLVLMDAVTGYPIKFMQPFPASEGGYILNDGTLLTADEENSNLQRFDKNLASLGAIALTGSSFTRISSNLTSTFLYSAFGNGAAHQIMRLIQSDGTVLPTVYDTGASGGWAVGLNKAASIAYYIASNAANTPVKAWDLVNNAGLTDLAAGVSGYAAIKDVIVLQDGTILVGRGKGTPNDFVLTRYGADGTTTSTYDFSNEFNADNRLAPAIDDPHSFWVWFHSHSFGTITNGFDQFRNIKVSDGSVIAQTPEVPQYEDGVFQGAVTDTIPRFGHSESCPFWIVRAGVSPTPTNKQTIRRQRRLLLPSSDSNFKVNIPDIEILIRAGIGIKPDSWTPDTATPLGADPQVMFRMSKDGGATWTNERWVSAGQRGQRERRVRLVRATGDYRNGVLEVTVDAPVDWQFISALGTPREGTS